MWKSVFSGREFIKKNSLTGLGAVMAIGATAPILYGFTKETGTRNT